MAAVKLLKGSEEFEMFQDYWKLIQQFWNVEDNDDYWESVTLAGTMFYEKYKSEYAKGLVLAYMDELDRKFKEREGV